MDYIGAVLDDSCSVDWKVLVRLASKLERGIWVGPAMMEVEDTTRICVLVGEMGRNTGLWKLIGGNKEVLL